MGNFDDLALAVQSFGGHNKVILDDLGKPSIMVGVPKMKYSDVVRTVDIGIYAPFPCLFIACVPVRVAPRNRAVFLTP